MDAFMVARYLTEIVRDGDALFRAHSTRKLATEHVENAARRRGIEWAGVYRIHTSGRVSIVAAFDGTDRGDGKWGGWRAAKGENHGLAKLTELIVREMRLAHANGEQSIGQLAARFQLHPEYARRVINRKAWKHVA